MIGVSKTFGGSSILSSPAKWKPVNPWKIEGLRALIVDVNAKIKAVDYSPIKAEQKHLCYMGTSQILMPENYIAMFDASQAEEARKIVKNAEPTIVMC